MSRVRAISAIAFAVITSVLLILPSAGQTAEDTLFVVKDGEAPSNVELAVRLSEETPIPDARRVVLARDDEFADALASGLMQSDSPLLLTPRTGLPELVVDQLARLAPEEVVLLGGMAALPLEIEQEVMDLGYEVSRREGPTRFETAAAIAASDGQDADTAIMVRAFAAFDATDPTQAFADSLAAGGMAARNDWPVLLTQAEVLTETTRDYLGQSAIRTVKLIGGTAAISQAVEDELEAMDMTVERIAGDSRADTAVEIAKDDGFDSAADVERVTLVEGQTDDAWAGGFAAAAHSARYDAPIVLGTSGSLLPETEVFLAAGAEQDEESTFAQSADDGIRLTCVIDADACREGRDALGLPPLPGEEPSPTPTPTPTPTATQPPSSSPPPPPPPSGLGRLLITGTCESFNHAQLSRDGTTVVTVVEPGCSSQISVTQTSFAFVDVASGSMQAVVPYSPTYSEREFAITSNGQAIAAGSADFSSTPNRYETQIVTPTGRTDVATRLGQPYDIQTQGTRSFTGDGTELWVIARDPSTGGCANDCLDGFMPATDDLEDLSLCGGVNVMVCHNTVVTGQTNTFLALGGQSAATSTTRQSMAGEGIAIRLDGSRAATTVDIPGTTDCVPVDISLDGALAVYLCDNTEVVPVDFASQTVLSPLSMTFASRMTGDARYVAGATSASHGIYDRTMGQFLPVDGTVPWPSDVGTAITKASDGIRIFDIADLPVQ